MRLVFLAVIFAISAASAEAADPNRICADSADDVRAAILDQSQQAKNLKQSFGILNAMPLSQSIAKIRKVGAERYLRETVASLDEEKICPANRGCKERILRKNEDSLDKLATLPEMYDKWYIFENIVAIDYDPNIERVTCRLGYFVDDVFIERWYAKMEVTNAVEDLRLVRQVLAALRATGETLVQKFIVQPSGRGGTNLSLIRN